MNNPYRRSIRLAGANYSGEHGYFITICTANRQYLFGAVTDAAMTLSPLGRIAEDELQAVTIHRPYVFLDTYVIMPDHMHAILFIDHGFAPRSDPGSVDPQLAAAPHNSIVSASQPVSDLYLKPSTSSGRSDRIGPQQAGLQGVAPQSRSSAPGSVDLQFAAAPHNSIVSASQPVSDLHPKPSTSSGRSDRIGPQQAAGLRGVAPQSLSAIVRGYKAAVTKRANELALCSGAPLWQRNYYDHIIRAEDDLNAIRAYIDTNPARWATDHGSEHPIWNLSDQ